MIISAHVTHKFADTLCLELIGKERTETLLAELISLEVVKECVVLRTCNRVELYADTVDARATRDGMEGLISKYIPFDQQSNLIQYLTDRGSVKHLLRVSAGLESMIVGEDQIQAQVKKALEISESNRCCGPILSQVFRKAISVGKKVRTKTQINKGSVSVGSAAVDLAEKVIGDLSEKRILVVGAGETAALIAKHLIGKDPNAIFVSNRTYGRAVELAFQLGGRAVRFNGLFEFLPMMDIVLVATSSPHILIDTKRVQKSMLLRDNGGKLVIIDLSLPRNVEDEVGQLENIELYSLDDLNGVAKENMALRSREIHKAEKIVVEELELIGNRLDEMRASELISALHSKYDNIKEREVRRAANRMENSNEPQKVLEQFASSLTKRFLADPIESLKSASREEREEMLELAIFLFKVKEEKNVS
jgi:glutamyl-tRNA reductase